MSPIPNPQPPLVPRADETEVRGCVGCGGPGCIGCVIPFGTVLVLLVSLGLGLVTMPSARAASSHTPGATAAYSRCLDKADGTTAGIADCQTAELARQNKTLNATYQALLHRLPAAAQARLRDEERGWIGQRDARCAAAARADAGGSASGLDAQDCQITETSARTQALRHWS